MATKANGLAGLRAGRPSTAAKPAPAATKKNVFTEDRNVRVNFDLTESEHKRLKVYAAHQGESVADLLRAHIRTLIK